MENTWPQKSLLQLETENPDVRRDKPKLLKLVIAGLIICLPVAGVGGYYLGINNQKVDNAPDTSIVKASPKVEAGVTCSLEVKNCPDGSSLGRTGANCEFAECPAPIFSEKVTTSGWVKYENEKHGFSLLHPSNSTISTRSDSNNDYIRIQNYVDKKMYSGLNDNEYYLEIFIEDENSGHDISETCVEKARDPEGYFSNTTKVILGEREGYRGWGYQGGESGGVRLALCTDGDGFKVFMTAVEGKYPSPIVNTIFDSFLFQ